MLQLNAACAHATSDFLQISSSQLPWLSSVCGAGSFLCFCFIPSTKVHFGVSFPHEKAADFHTSVCPNYTSQTVCTLKWFVIRNERLHDQQQLQQGNYRWA